MSDSCGEQPQSQGTLFDAIEQGDAARVAQMMVPQSFTLLEVADDTSEDEYAALTAEVDDYPLLVAFTSDDCAGEFAGAMPDLFEGDGDVPGFVVVGANLLTHLPDGFGVLLNPETENCCILPPELVDDVAAKLIEE